MATWPKTKFDLEFLRRCPNGKPSCGYHSKRQIEACFKDCANNEPHDCTQTHHRFQADPSKPSPFDSLPLEIHHAIFKLLDGCDLSAIRLVCRTAKEVATEHLFYCARLNQPGGAFGRWMSWTEDSHLSQIPRAVTIYTAPTTIKDGRFKYGRHLYPTSNEVSPNMRMGRLLSIALAKAFYSRIARLQKLPALHTACLHFTNQTFEPATPEHHLHRTAHESLTVRLNFLQHFFKALYDRQKIIGVSQIHTLEIMNLQDTPTPRFAASNIFQDVIQEVQNLKLLIVPGTTIYDLRYFDCESRREFLPYLRQYWLNPIARRLKSLSLCYTKQYWGSLPGNVNDWWSSLDLPQLETLTISRYAIAYDDSLDWILRQKTLQSLHLRNCPIVSHLRFHSSDPPGVPTTGWVKYSTSPRAEGSTNYHNPVVWAEVFDRIGRELPRLRNFSVYTNILIEELSIYAVTMTWDDRKKEESLVPYVQTDCPARRYTGFDHRVRNKWRVPDNYGDMKFMDDWEDVPYHYTEEFGQFLTVNRYRETFENDNKALEKLLLITDKRRGRG